MGQGFSSNELSGVATSTTPSTSYAFSPTNTARFGIDAYYDGCYNAPFCGKHAPVGLVTPYFVGPTGSAVCEPIPAATSTSILCPAIAGTALDPGLYTLSFSQYSSSATYNSVGSFISYTRVPGSPYTAIGLDVTFSIVKPFLVTSTQSVESTITSGVAQSLATSTATVAQTTVTVTVVSTTVVSTTTSASTFQTAKIITTTEVCAASATTTLIPPKGCNQNNCLRAMLNRPAQNSPFCSGYTTGAPTPSYLSVCSGKPSAAVFACSCFAKSTPKAQAKARGVVAYAYGPPDFTYYAGRESTTVVSVSDTTTVPSTTTTDPASTITSGTLSSTTSVATTTVTVFTSITSVTSPTSTYTFTPASCLSG